MSKQFLVSINLNKNELQNAIVHPLATAPSSPKAGQIYYNSTDNSLYYYNGTAWVKPGAVASVNGQTGVVVLNASDVGALPDTTAIPAASTAAPQDLGDSASAGTGTAYSRGNHVHKKPYKAGTATPTTSDISNGEFYLQLAGGPLTYVNSVNGMTGAVTLTQDDIGDGTTYKQTHNDLTDALVALINGALQKSGGTMSGAINMGSKKITNLATPTANTDAATKKYADDLVAGLGAVFKFKGTKATTGDLPLSGNTQGDVWLVSADGSEYVWTSTSASGTIDNWEKLGVVVDLSGYAPLASPALTGTPTAPTAAAGTNTTQIATTAFVKTATDNISGTVKTATGTISTSATTVSVSYTGTVINSYATMSGSVVVTDVSIAASSVTFTCAARPSSTVTCTVIYV